jgi:pyruvate/2-oxoglutarate dehydrogenase complex dihydrolipoamide acyltransferase (E2) component
MKRTPDDDCWVLRAPRLNANDDSVTLTRWLARDRATIAAGAPVAEIETEKATAELCAERGGTLLQAVPAGAKVPIGAPLAYVGPTLAAADDLRRSRPERRPPAPSVRVAATAKAQALAAARGVDLGAVRASGATIQERDVARHLAEHGAAAADVPGDPRLVLAGDASAHQLRVARDLRTALQAGVFTTLAYRLDLRGPERRIAAELARGRAVSLLVLLLAALGRALPRFPALMSVIARDRIYRWRDLDIAFAARSPAGELQAPVVRRVDRLGVDALARECARLAKQAMRGKLDAGDIGGACFTVSLIAMPNVESFVALPPPLQGAILSLGATRQEIELTAAGPVARPVATATVTYDHALCDGVTVAEFCAALDRALNAEPA